MINLLNNFEDFDSFESLKIFHLDFELKIKDLTSTTKFGLVIIDFI